MTLTQTKCDPRALRVAEDLHRKLEPKMTILFGSRARGDYEDGRSDIDIMVVQKVLPSGSEQLAMQAETQAGAETIYDHYVPVQLFWQTGNSLSGCDVPSTT